MLLLVSNQLRMTLNFLPSCFHLQGAEIPTLDWFTSLWWLNTRFHLHARQAQYKLSYILSPLFSFQQGGLSFYSAQYPSVNGL